MIVIPISRFSRYKPHSLSIGVLNIAPTVTDIIASGMVCDFATMWINIIWVVKVN